MPRNPASSRPALPAAVSTLVAEVVHGPPVDATVVGAHRYAVYLAVGGAVLPVVTSDAVPLPTACASPCPRARWRGASTRARTVEALGVASGDVVRVGAGRVALPGLDVVAARTWRPARVRPGSLTSRASAEVVVRAAISALTPRWLPRVEAAAERGSRPASAPCVAQPGAQRVATAAT